MGPSGRRFGRAYPGIGKSTLFTATAVALSLPLALPAADQTKKRPAPFAAADANGDGRISPGEYVAAMMAKKQGETAAKAKFAELDKNNDGFLSREEFEAGSAVKKGSRKMKDGS